MSVSKRSALAAAALMAAAPLAVLTVVLRQGLAADRAPGRLESVVAGRLVRLSIPAAQASLRSPLAGDPQAWRGAGDAFRGRCAACHATNGRGPGAAGPRMYPPVPDLGSAPVQRLSDGELFAVIRNGVRWTGMPSFRSVLDDATVWRLVAYVRQVPAGVAQDSAQDEGPAGEEAVEIVMDGTRFTPSERTVTLGQAVRWANADPFPHNVLSRSGAFHSADIESGGRWLYRPTARGVFAYECTLHPGMAGVLRVR